jgi:hypothetical protein
MVPTAVVPVETAVVTAMETTMGTRHCRAHTCNCGNRRNENLVDLHVITSFFFESFRGVGKIPPPV